MTVFDTNTEFDSMVETAALRMAGLSDEQIASAIVPLAKAFEEAVSRASPTLSADKIRDLRDFFLSRVGDRVREIAVAGGSKSGTA